MRQKRLQKKRKKDEAQDEKEKKKGLNPDQGDDALTKLHVKRDKKAKELNKLLKIVERTKQRMKTDITNLNHLSSDVLALHQEIEYRKNLLQKKGVVVSNQPKSKQDLEMTARNSSGGSVDNGGVGSPTANKYGGGDTNEEIEVGVNNDAPGLEPASYNNAYEA